jgi:hypothetical protein
VSFTGLGFNSISPHNNKNKGKKYIARIIDHVGILDW